MTEHDFELRSAVSDEERANLFRSLKGKLGEMATIFPHTLFLPLMLSGENLSDLATHFGEKYPQNLTVSDIVSDALTGIRVAFGPTIYECENCGRLWLQPIPEKNS